MPDPRFRYASRIEKTCCDMLIRLSCISEPTKIRPASSRLCHDLSCRKWRGHLLPSDKSVMSLPERISTKREPLSVSREGLARMSLIPYTLRSIVRTWLLWVLGTLPSSTLYRCLGSLSCFRQFGGIHATLFVLNRRTSDRELCDISGLP